MKHIVFWINTRPRKEGLSDVYSPRAILTETMPDYQVRCKLQVGTYCEVHDDPTPTNSTLTRSLPAIALEPVGNFQGGYKFMSVNTGQVLTRYKWTEVLVPEQIIRRVEARAKKERKIEKSSDELPPLVEFVHRDKVIDDSGDLHNNQGAMNTGTSGNEQEPEPDHTTEKNDDDQEIISEEIEERETIKKESSEDQGAESEERSQTRSGRYYYRNPKYQHLYPEEAYTALTIRKPSDGIGNKYCYATNILLLQMSAKRGLEVFGERAEDALVKEYKQFDEKEVFVPVMFDSLKPEERKKALNAISLIEQKRTGKVKGRTVADGSMQRHYIEKGDAASPTVTTEAVLITSAIEAHEKRVVATCDISGAFLQAEMEDYVIVVFRNEAAEMLIKSNAKYKRFLHTTRSGKKLIYVRLKKAMYGCMKAALLFWKNLSEFLTKELGFKINDYDSCVANKNIDGTQCTIIWHVDDLKISHRSEAVVKDIISRLEVKYGKMSLKIGKIHTYVGMNIEYNDNGTVSIEMKDYLLEAIKDFPEELENNARTPAANNLFTVNAKTPKIPEEKRVILHRVTARLLFVGKRARPDIQVAVGFLSTRVTKADEDDWRKLRRLLRYIKGSLELKLTLKVADLTVVKWWVDVSYAMNHDMKSQTGAIMTLGGGAFYAKTAKQKINTKSSTEGELVGASDMSGQILWTSRFLMSQGYKVKKSILYQDNQSAMLLEKNGQLSSRQRTKHINVRYFFMKDRIQDGEIEVIYCPTEDMIGDYFTKPLQGKKFEEFRAFIMGLHLVNPQERVVENGEVQQVSKDSEF